MDHVLPHGMIVNRSRKMPELPEVETVKKSLTQHLLNRQIKKIDILYPRMILTPLDEFYSLEGATIKNILRKGKFLIFLFDNHRALISHLRMEGKYYYYREDEENSSHARIVFHLDKNEKVIYDDTRKFGIMELHYDNDYLESECLKKLGREPFDADEEYLYKKIHNLKIDIKSAILDQTILAGIGNIYADETLFASKINPFRKSFSITKEECQRIILHSREILSKAIEQGGSTVSSYHPENGVDGKFQLLLNAYGRNKKPCKICQTLMLKDFIGGRGTVYCPHCQKVSKTIGIYGKVASGKSTLLKYFKELGYATFSSDEYVSSLYAKLETKAYLINLFSEEVLLDNSAINKAYIKNIISTDEAKRIQLENYFFPLVKKAIAEFKSSHKEDQLVFIEVPLLFEAKIDSLMDYIIAIDTSYPHQLTNLSQRGSKTPEIDLRLNSSNKFDKYISKCDYIIHNNGTLLDLKEKADETLKAIINK